MTGASEHRTGIASVEELTAHAYALEREAADRYGELADAMTIHHRHDIAELFRRMADAERRHAQWIHRRYGDGATEARAPWQYKWTDFEGSETVPSGSADIAMTPRAALQLALAAEQRALAFYESVRENAADDTLRSVAEELASEERGHVQLMKRWLSRVDDEGDIAIEDDATGQ